MSLETKLRSEQEVNALKLQDGGDFDQQNLETFRRVQKKRYYLEGYKSEKKKLILKYSNNL